MPTKSGSFARALPVELVGPQGDVISPDQAAHGPHDAWIVDQGVEPRVKLVYRLNDSYRVARRCVPRRVLELYGDGAGVYKTVAVEHVRLPRLAQLCGRGNRHFSGITQRGKLQGIKNGLPREEAITLVGNHFMRRKFKQGCVAPEYDRPA